MVIGTIALDGLTLHTDSVIVEPELEEVVINVLKRVVKTKDPRKVINFGTNEMNKVQLSMISSRQLMKLLGADLRYRFFVFLRFVNP